MTMIIIGIAVGALYLGMTIHTLNKKKKTLENINLSKYTMIDESKMYIYILIGLLVVSLIGIYLGVINKNNDNISLGIMLVFLAVSEMLNAKVANTYYYNDTGFVINGKAYRFKSIKQIVRISSIFMKRYELTTINGDKEIIPAKAANKINELWKKK